MNRHSEESSTLTRPAGAPRSGKQAGSVAKRLMIPGPPPSVQGSRNLQTYPKKTHTKPTEKIHLNCVPKQISTESTIGFYRLTLPMTTVSRCIAGGC